MPVKRTLLITLPPHITGGVGIMGKILADHLRNLGHKVTVAHYATYKDYSDLSVPLTKFIRGHRSSTRSGTCFDDHDSIAVGCFLPELEVSYTNDSSHWRALIQSHERHVVASGSVLAATPLVRSNVPHITWCATDALGDRLARLNAMPIVRRLFNKSVVTPLVRRAEQRVLNGNGRIIGISPYTIACLRLLHPEQQRSNGLVPIPVDTSLFQIEDKETVLGRIGFVGRLSDERKNLGLLLNSFDQLRDLMPNVELILAGEGGEALTNQIHRLNLDKVVTFVGRLPTEDLAALYRSLDVFVIPSHQEGLGIVGLEAMASGVPVVATQCGGPEVFVRNDETGYLVRSNPDDMARAIFQIIQDRDKRNLMSLNAQNLVKLEYSHSVFAEAFAREWEAVWNETI